jgi:hypothetical protein
VNLPHVFVALLFLALASAPSQPARAGDTQLVRRDFLQRAWATSIGQAAFTIRRELEQFPLLARASEDGALWLDRVMLISRIPLEHAALVSEGGRLLASSDPEDAQPVPPITASHPFWSPTQLFQAHPTRTTDPSASGDHWDIVVPVTAPGSQTRIYFAGRVSPKQLFDAVRPEVLLLPGEEVFWWDRNGGPRLYHGGDHDPLGPGDAYAATRRDSLQSLLRTVREQPNGRENYVSIDRSTGAPALRSLAWKHLTLGTMKVAFAHARPEIGAPPAFGELTGLWRSTANPLDEFALLQDGTWCRFTGRGNYAGIDVAARILDGHVQSFRDDSDTFDVFNVSGTVKDGNALHLHILRERDNAVQLVKMTLHRVAPSSSVPLELIPMRTERKPTQ